MDRLNNDFILHSKSSCGFIDILFISLYIYKIKGLELCTYTIYIFECTGGYGKTCVETKDLKVKIIWKNLKGF